MDDIGWLVLLVVLPATAPIVGAYVIWRTTRGEEKKKLTHPKRSIKDGQLVWVALAFCGSGAYEIHVARDGIDWLNWGIGGGFAFIVFISGIVAAQGALDPPPFPMTTDDDKSLMRTAFWLTVAAAVLFITVHFEPQIGKLFRAIGNLL
jgi:hypothetical protein